MAGVKEHSDDLAHEAIEVLQKQYRELAKQNAELIQELKRYEEKYGPREE